MEAAFIPISKTDNDHHIPISEERISAGIKKERNADGRTFLTVLRQSLAKSQSLAKLGKKEQINLGDERAGEEAGISRKVKRKLMDGSRLKKNKSGIRSDKTGGKLKHLGSDGKKSQGRQDVLEEYFAQTGQRANGVAQAANMVIFENRKEGDNTSIIRRAIDRKVEDNLTSIAPRVEVQDKRPKAARVNPASRVRNFEHLSSRSNEDVKGKFRMEGEPMGVDMEIEIPTRFEKGNPPRSAAMEFARRLNGQIGNEIVRQIKIVLNHSSAGELRINLKPENLGRVRVEIQLEDNHLSGKFFAESSAAREVLKGALDGLQTRLLESGFETADLEMARDDSSPNFRFNDDNSRNRKTEDAASKFEENLSVDAFIELDDNLVNLVV